MCEGNEQPPHTRTGSAEPPGPKDSQTQVGRRPHARNKAAPGCSHSPARPAPPGPQEAATLRHSSMQRGCTRLQPRPRHTGPTRASRSSDATVCLLQSGTPQLPPELPTRLPTKPAAAEPEALPTTPQTARPNKAQPPRSHPSTLLPTNAPQPCGLNSPGHWSETAMWPYRRAEMARLLWAGCSQPYKGEPPPTP